MTERRTFRIDKLVRDNVPNRVIDEGGSVKSRILNKQEFLNALEQKLVEEAQEFAAAGSAQKIKELVDLQEVVQTILALGDISEEEFAKIQQEKRRTHGAFTLGIFVTEIALPANNSWVEEYAKKYSEITSTKWVKNDE